MDPEINQSDQLAGQLHGEYSCAQFVNCSESETF
jgi:hypothetical protein